MSNSTKDAEYCLWQLDEIAHDLDCVENANHVLQDERFLYWSGSSKPSQHHYGKGGLCRHTWEVVSLCLQSNEFFQYGPSFTQDGCDRYCCVPELLYLAALYHDIGKLDDYMHVDLTFEKWISTEHKFKIHHITKSAMVFANKATDLTPEQKEEVIHAVLAHHGLREWGSPVSPKTPMAWILHLCDNMSARLEDYNRNEHLR